MVYWAPPVFKPGFTFVLKKITFLPISWPNVSNIVTLNEGKDIFIAQNLQNTLTQVLPNLDDCKRFNNFYKCTNNGVNFKESDRCILAIMENKGHIFRNCPFTPIGRKFAGYVKQIEKDEFVIFTAKEASKLKSTWKINNKFDLKSTVITNLSK